MQVRIGTHTKKSLSLKIGIEHARRSFDEDWKQFFKLFEESMFEGSRAAARKMKKIAKRQSKTKQQALMFFSLSLLTRSDSQMLSWPNSPLLVLLQFVDPNVLFGHDHPSLREGEKRVTPLYFLADLADPSDYSTHVNQLILAKQLIKHGANVNAVTTPEGETPLYNACSGDVVTNLDFVELLLRKGADPNFQDFKGLTPLMSTVSFAPGAAKFLLNWPTTDANITTQSGGSYLAGVRVDVKYFRSDHPERVEHQLALRQWREIEEMLVERGAVDTGIATGFVYE
jgi:hypothetical protein